ncbi:MAG TPA: flagellar assembly peptidoglycan hydrolase FlgJ [Luteimonas sp.]|nr:flagellar assembly peptidoglycan hydrolase FlgJ [Luteimonas sp.]
MRLQPATAIPLDASAAPPRADVEKAARELETQFARMLIKTMRSASMGDPMLGNDTTYREMYDQQLATQLTKGRGLGLAPMIARQLGRGAGDATQQAGSAGLPLRAPAATALPLPASPAAIALPLSPAHGAAFAAPPVSSTLSLAPAHGGVSMPALALPAYAPRPAAAECPDVPLDCSSPEAFVQSIWPQAQKTAAELGVPARALVAQAALETGWGRRLAGREGASSHNLFGIKAGGGWDGGRVSSSTHEYVAGVRVSERADFRAYGSPADSFADYARLLRKPRYAGARGVGDDTRRFASALQRAGYATDPRYADKITAIANGATLERALAALPSTGAAAYASNAVAMAATRE